MHDKIQQIFSALQKIAITTPAVTKIYLFGSRARGDNQEKSDIDLAIVAPKITTKEWLDLCDKIEEIDTLLEIDIVNFNEAGLNLQNKILQEGKVIYEQH
jgi:uncharacterized protein